MIEDWVDVTGRSAKAVAGEMGFRACQILGAERVLPKGLAGAFIPLVGQSASLQLGVLSTKVGQEGLARVVLQMEPGDVIDTEDVTDAVGELSNCLVGRIKREMRKVDPSLKIGLPVFIEGSVQDTGSSDFRTLGAIMNDIRVSILIIVGV